MKNEFLAIVGGALDASIAGNIGKACRKTMHFQPSMINISSDSRVNKEEAVFVDLELNQYGKQQLSFDNDYFHISLSGYPVSELYNSEGCFAEAIASFLKKDSFESLIAKIYGSFSIIVFDKIKRRLIALADPSGVEPIFYSKTGGKLLVSSRSSLISYILSESFDIDPSILAEIGMHANILGGDSIFKNVMHLKPGEILSCSLGCPQFIIEKSSDFFNNSHKSNYIDAAEGFIKTWEVFGKFLPNEITLSLTGGKDSRLNLAGALAAGLKDRILCFTNGSEDHPEVEAARQVAKQAGVRHIHRPPSKKVVELDPSLMWTRLFNHPKMHDWQVCPWDGLADPISIEENFTFSYEVSGFGAAVYKPVGRDYRNINFNDSMSLEKFFHNWQQPSNIFNIYNKDILDKSIEKLVSRSKALLDEGEKAENLSARLFLDGRGPLWGGILSKNVLKRVRLYPFLDHRVLSNGFSQRQEDRGSYRFHFEVMNICNAGLARMPFLDDQWPSNLSQYGANISPPFKTHFKPTSINMVPQKWSFLHSESDNIKDFILSSRNSPLFDIVNYNNALPAIERLFSESNVVYAKSIFNLIYFKLVLEGLQNDSCHFLKSKDKFIIKSNNKDLEFCFRNGYLSGQASYYYSSAEGKSEKVNFEIPVNTKKVRLDPMKEKGVFVIRRLFYIIDGLEKDISINDIKLKNMNLVGSNNNSYTLVATSDDPQLIFNAVNEVCPSSLTCYINLKRKSKLELFYDSGHGFNEGEKLIRCIN